jgi:hypothetical protein
MRVEENKIIVEPFELPDLTQFFDSVEVDVKTDLADWRSVKDELLEVR